MNKGYTYRGVLVVVLLLGALFTGGFMFKDSFNSNENTLWSYTTPVETGVSSSGNEGEIIIDQYQESEDSGYKKTLSNKVYWENSKGKIEVTPHTCTSLHCEFFIDMTNKDTINHDLNIAFKFPDHTKNHKFYQLEYVTKIRPTYNNVTYYGQDENNQTIEQWRFEQNGTEEYQVEEYVDRSDAFTKTVIDGENVFYTTDVTFLSLTKIKGKFTYDTAPKITKDGFGSSGKWEMMLWKGNYQNPSWKLLLDPWFNTAFEKRFKVTINSTSVSENLTDFPVFFNLSNAPSEFWDSVKSDGSDIVVTQGEDVQIPRELVTGTFSISNNEGELWFKGNLSSIEDTEFYIYYNNSAATETNDDATWNDDARQILHIQETGEKLDSTSNKFNMTENGSPTDLEVQLYNGIDLGDNAADALIDDDTEEAVEGLANFTISAWVTIDDLHTGGVPSNTFNTLVQLHQAFSIEYDGDDNDWGVSVSGSGGGSVTDSTIEDGNKHLLHVVRSGDTLEIFLDGNSIGTDTGMGTNSVGTGDANEYIIGQEQDGTGGIGTAESHQSWAGKIDEYRVWNTSLSSGWANSEYINQNNPTVFYEAGAEEEFIVDVDVVLDEPINGQQFLVQGAIDFNQTATLTGNITTGQILNASTYNNRTGTFELRASNTSAVLNNTQFTIEDGSFSDGTYIWNTEVCFNSTPADTGIPEVGCSFADSNFTFTVSQPGLELRVFDEKTGTQLTFNVTVSNTTGSVEFTNQTVLDEHISNLTTGLSTISPVNFTGGYEPRNYYATLSDLIKFNLTAYLIKTADSVDVTFTVQTFQNQPIEDAFIEVSHPTLGLVAQEFTDGTGKATFALDPTIEYLIDISKDGFDPITNFGYKPSSPFAQTFILGEEIPIQTDTTFQGMSYRFKPSGSFVIITNGTGEIDLITSAQTLEWWSLNLTYNNTSLFFENKTTSSGGSINGAFNVTDSLGLNETFFPSNFTDKTLTATFQFKKTGESAFTVIKNYTMAESAGLYSLLKNSPFTDGVKGLVWMILTLFVGAFTGFFMRNPVITGLVVVAFMGLGVALSWLPLLLFGMVILGLIGILLAYRLRG